MKKLVLTGGPCAGKTTAKAYLFDQLSNYGSSVVFVPEAATLIIDSGLNPRKLDREKSFRFQKLLFKTQMIFEDQIFSEALDIKGSEKQVMITDRGLMDNIAYTGKDDFDRILKEHRLTITDVRDKRYDAVFHLVTAADGKEEFYTITNNQARTETPEQARALDKKIQEAWLGHPHLKVIENSTLFDGKMKRLFQAVQRALGIPVEIEIEKKFLVKDSIDFSQIPVPYQKIEIEQFYLKTSGGAETRVRKRTQEGSGSVYYQTTKTPVKDGSNLSRIEVERQISEREYYASLRNWDYDNFDRIYKIRVCFLWNNQYFELDYFIDPERLRGLMLLEIELTEENDKVDVPLWVGEVEDVTENPRYTNHNLSRRP